MKYIRPTMITLCLTCLIIGCAQPEKTIVEADKNGLNPNGNPAIPINITNDSNQTTETIPYSQLHQWLKNNKNKYIHNIIPISKAKYAPHGGHTTTFIIIHSPSNNPNCILCGQKKPIEKP